jgi:uncharacterized protein YndB with AHSA1/START domain
VEILRGRIEIEAPFRGSSAIAVNHLRVEESGERVPFGHTGFLVPARLFFWAPKRAIPGGRPSTNSPSGPDPWETARRMHDDDLALHMTRVLPAPRALVWAALTDPGELAKWWGPHGFTTPSINFDPQVGGSYRIAMQPPEGDKFHLSGEFREVDPPARLAYTFNWEPHDPDDRETLVTLSMQDRGESTELDFTLGTFATEARRALHEQGWTEGFERLQELLS